MKNRAQELCESRGGRPGLPVPNSLYGLCGRKATLEDVHLTKRKVRREATIADIQTEIFLQLKCILPILGCSVLTNKSYFVSSKMWQLASRPTTLIEQFKTIGGLMFSDFPTC